MDGDAVLFRGSGPLPADPVLRGGRRPARTAFAYLQLVLIAVFGITIFGEVLRWNVAFGAVIVVAAGLFTWWRQQMRALKTAIAPTIPG